MRVVYTIFILVLFYHCYCDNDLPENNDSLCFGGYKSWNFNKDRQVTYNIESINTQTFNVIVFDSKDEYYHYLHSESYIYIESSSCNKKSVLVCANSFNTKNNDNYYIVIENAGFTELCIKYNFEISGIIFEDESSDTSILDLVIFIVIICSPIVACSFGCIIFLFITIKCVKYRVNRVNNQYNIVLKTEEPETELKTVEKNINSLQDTC